MIDIIVERSGSEQATQLREVSDISRTLSEILPQLTGLEWIEVHRNDADIVPAYDSAECRREYNRPTNCQPSGYGVRVSMSVRAGPPERAGDLVSLAAQHGATSAEIGGFYVRNDDSHSLRAREMAIADARHQAEAFARAAGMELGSVLSIRAGDERYYYMARERLPDADSPMPAMMEASSQAPDVALDLDPDLRRYVETVTVRFELRDSAPSN